MSDIHIQIDQLEAYPGRLTGMADRSRQLATGAAVVTTTTGRADSAEAAMGLADHFGALISDIGAALDHDAGEVRATLETLLIINREAGTQLRNLM
ncbi:MAG: hypothetical protein ACRDRP_03200 [Pseudonocardiaceae bacterium]